MRKIKFRGKRKDNGEWVTGCLLIEEPPLQCFTPKNPEPNKYLIGKSGFADWNMQRPFTAAEVYPESVGQFTGRKDKNGKEIYENDLVRFEDEGIVFTIQYCGSSFVMHHGSDEAAIEYVLDRFNNDVEVIGNIYENPELIK